MLLHLRRRIFQAFAINTGICFSLATLVCALSGYFQADKLLWLLVLSCFAGLGGAGYIAHKIKRGILGSLQQDISYLRIAREDGQAREFDWFLLDDYATQLAGRGFSHLGDFTLFPTAARLQGVAACFLNLDASIMIEVQQIRVADESGQFGGREVHFSLGSVLGGKIRVVTTDHQLRASNFMVRGQYMAIATYPGMGLLALLDKHEKFCRSVQNYSGKPLSQGLSMERHILLQRETLRQARERLQAMNGYDIASELDWFEQHAPSKWATPSHQLSALAACELSELDHSPGSRGPALVVSSSDDGQRRYRA